MAPSSMSSAKTRPSIGSSDDEYISVSHSPIGQVVKGAGVTPMHSYVQGKSSRKMPSTEPMTLHAGITPGPFTKQTSHSFSRQRRFPSIRLSNVGNSAVVGRVVGSSHKRKCLFDTMHVKPALALLTVFYLLGLALLDQLFFILEMSEFAYMLFGVSSIGFVIAVLIAQYGLLRGNHYLILPFLGVQGIFTLVVCAAYFHQMAAQLLFVHMHPQVAMRLILLMLHETILTVMQVYAVIVTWRCMNYLYSKGQVRTQERPPMMCTRKLVYDAPNETTKDKGRSVSLRIDMDTDEEGNYKMGEQLKKASIGHQLCVSSSENNEVETWTNALSEAAVNPRASILVKQGGEHENKNGNSIPLPSSSVKRKVSFVNSALS